MIILKNSDMTVQTSDVAISAKEFDVDFNWQNFLLISFTVYNYGNYGPSCLVSRSTFSRMSTGARIFLTYGGATFQIYPNGNGKVHIKTTDDIPAYSQLKTMGIISKT